MSDLKCDAFVEQAVLRIKERELRELLQIALAQRWWFTGFEEQARKLGASDREIKRLWLSHVAV